MDLQFKINTRQGDRIYDLDKMKISLDEIAKNGIHPGVSQSGVINHPPRYVNPFNDPFAITANDPDAILGAEISPDKKSVIGTIEISDDSSVAIRINELLKHPIKFAPRTAGTYEIVENGVNEINIDEVISFDLIPED